MLLFVMLFFQLLIALVQVEQIAKHRMNKRNRLDSQSLFVAKLLKGMLKMQKILVVETRHHECVSFPNTSSGIQVEHSGFGAIFACCAYTARTPTAWPNTHTLSGTQGARTAQMRCMPHHPRKRELLSSDESAK